MALLYQLPVWREVLVPTPPPAVFSSEPGLWMSVSTELLRQEAGVGKAGLHSSVSSPVFIEQLLSALDSRLWDTVANRTGQVLG